MPVRDIPLPSKDSLFVNKLPDYDKILDSYAGLMPVDSTSKQFFWLFKSVEKSNKLMIWLNGGPGCSSMDGAFLENGPFRFEKGKLVTNPWSWHTKMNVVYVDQPIGTGYSTGSFRSNIEEIVVDFNEFLRNFFTVFHEFSNADLFLAGESFAGIWIPYFADYLFKNGDIKISGILLGNPWIDPKNQYTSYLSFSMEKNLLHGNYLTLAQRQHQLCLDYLKGPPSINIPACDKILQIVLQESQDNGKFCLNKYDIRLRDNGPHEGCGMSWPPGVYDLAYYLSQPNVKKSLHANPGPERWTECESNVHNSLRMTEIAPTINLFSSLLEKIPIGIFTGDQDLICNVYGLNNSLKSLYWRNLTGFTKKQEDWKVNGNIIGTKNSERGLSYYVFYNASHMVPFDLPEESLLMATEFVNYKFAMPDELLIEEPSHLYASIFMVFLLTVAIFGGLFIRKKLRNNRRWNQIPEEAIELTSPTPRDSNLIYDKL